MFYIPSVQRDHPSRRRGRGAFDLTELALYLVAGIILLIGIIALFSNVFGSSKTVETETQFNDIITDVHSLYSSQSSYSTLTTSVLINSGGLSQSWVSGTSIVNPYKGSIAVTANATSFDVYEYGLPAAACVTLATTAPPGDLLSIVINNQGGYTTILSTTTAQQQCNAAGNNNSVSITLD